VIGVYKITNLTYLGFPSVEVEGPSFHMHDLHEMVGRAGYMTSFVFRPDSKTYQAYGQVVTGTMFNGFHTVRYLDGLDTPAEPPDVSILCIDSPDRSLSVEQKKSLKYRGVPLADLMAISFLPYSRPVERHTSGEKLIPNVIHIKADFSDVDESKLIIGLLTSKNNSDYQLIQFEKEKLVGTILGLYGGIDKRIATHFGFDAKSLQSNVNVALAQIRAKSIHQGLTESEEKAKTELVGIKQTEAFIAVASELTKANLPNTVSDKTQEALRGLVQSALKFEPKVLLSIKRQIFWDLNSYVHIAMGHIKEFQLGKHQDNTPLPYKPEDLSGLIEKVLDSIADEIELHFKTGKGRFRRSGKMSAFFNGDYFNLIIDENGRLEQFHSVSERR
jgi:hypothetical protein